VAAADSNAADRLRGELSGRGIPAAVTSASQDDAWRDELRRFHQPVTVGGRLRIRPPWVEADPELIDIVIDPGMAFGTGQHATTRGCLELLLETSAASVLDVGCGSGVLSIAACKLGHHPVVAIDVDPLAIDATARNARANGVELDVRPGDAGRESLPAGEVLLANVTANHVAALAAALVDAPDHAILSGFRPDELDVAIGPWRDRGYTVRRRIDADDWTALTLTPA
jgi:ribosomal protein L11 methyltransferase